ncbi:hypothetical protein VIM7927_01974 [Vibrio mangrovi]|uniref:Uncharacterized protein n=1 Tax=Vibrio mangrovi TaxID=474394 RepID=A0A1Y6IST4_9VIBR|nr:hypothetical protein VIM7927_01974 [Vibrio mangrovi]
MLWQKKTIGVSDRFIYPVRSDLLFNDDELTGFGI